ncbi:hypothetical protein BH23PLA1_BH23PLA1_38300 [soil metagenome]
MGTIHCQCFKRVAPAALAMTFVLSIPLGGIGQEEGLRAPRYDDHTRLLVVKDGQGNEVPVESPADWAVRRAHILAHLQEVMGPLPGGERRVPLAIEILEEIDEPKFVRKKITFATEPGDRVPAWLLIPKEESLEVDDPQDDLPGPETERQADQIKGRRPAILCPHPTTPIGKDIVVGLGDRPNRDQARELAERGYVVLAPDYPNFGEYKLDVYEMGYVSASMKGIWNHKRGIDLLASLPEVDPDRIGVIGHSLGGHNSIFVALFDDRVKAVVSSCGFNSFPYYYEGNIAGWSHNGYMPRLRADYDLDPARVPFDFPELIAALAPRPFFTNSPLHDANFEVEGVRVCIETAQPVYELLGAGDHLKAVYPDAEHDFPPEVRAEAYEFLDRHLGSSR